MDDHDLILFPLAIKFYYKTEIFSQTVCHVRMGVFPTCRKIPHLLPVHIVRIHNVLPPVIVDSVDTPSGLREVGEPPYMMLAYISIAPIAGSDLTSLPAKIGEVEHPVIALADDRGWIVPVVIALTIRSKMDVT